MILLFALFSSTPTDNCSTPTVEQARFSDGATGMGCLRTVGDCVSNTTVLTIRLTHIANRIHVSVNASRTDHNKPSVFVSDGDGDHRACGVTTPTFEHTFEHTCEGPIRVVRVIKSTPHWNHDRITLKSGCSPNNQTDDSRLIIGLMCVGLLSCCVAIFIYCWRSMKNEPKKPNECDTSYVNTFEQTTKKPSRSKDADAVAPTRSVPEPISKVQPTLRFNTGVSGGPVRSVRPSPIKYSTAVRSRSVPTNRPANSTRTRSKSAQRSRRRT